MWVEPKAVLPRTVKPLGTGCRLSQLLFFPTFSSLVSIIYTSKKLTLLNEIALEIAFGAWDVARYQSWLAFFYSTETAFGPWRRRALSWAGPRAISVSSVHTSDTLRQILLLIWFSKLEVCLLRSNSQGLQRTRSTLLLLEETSEAGISVILLSGRALVTIASPSLAPAWYPGLHHNLSFCR